MRGVRWRQGADGSIDGAAVAKQDQRRNAEDATSRAEAWLIVDTEVDYRELVRELAGDRVDM